MLKYGGGSPTTIATDKDFEKSAQELEKYYKGKGEASNYQVGSGGVPAVGKALERLGQFSKNMETGDKCCETIDVLGHGVSGAISLPKDDVGNVHRIGPEQNPADFSKFIKDVESVLCKKCETEGDCPVRLHTCYSGSVCDAFATELKRCVFGYPDLVGFASSAPGGTGGEVQKHHPPRAGDPTKPPKVYPGGGAEPTAPPEGPFKPFMPKK